VTYRVEYSEAARADLRDIEDYLRAVAGDATAEKVTARISSKVESFASRPTRQRLRRNLGAGLRALRVGDHLIFYRIRDEAVSIVRILHGSRDITPTLFPQSDDV
jgi:toxin ParE1/3/4